MGFTRGIFLNDDDLELIRSLVRLQYLDHIRQVAPAHFDRFAGLPTDQYHRLAPLIDHDVSWPVSARIFSRTAVERMKKETALFKYFEGELGPFTLLMNEINWRIVRPNTKQDVGPVHADVWFLDYDKSYSPPPGTERIKVWIGLYCEPGLNGLRVVRGSHLRQWRYHGEERDGVVKPRIDENVEELDLQTLPTQPGEAVVLSDHLLHVGSLNRAQNTRVSCEFSLCVPIRPGKS